MSFELILKQLIWIANIVKKPLYMDFDYISIGDFHYCYSSTTLTEGLVSAACMANAFYKKELYGEHRIGAIKTGSEPGENK